MVQQTITYEYDELVTKTERETVTYCDGCAEPCEEYETISDISFGDVERIVTHTNPAPAYKAVKLTADEFHLCRGCLHGLRQHGQTLDTAIYDAPPERKTAANYDGGPVEYALVRATKIVVAMGLVFLSISLYALPLGAIEVGPEIEALNLWFLRDRLEHRKG